MDSNCNIPDLVQTFSDVENGGFYMFTKLTAIYTSMWF